LGIVAHPLFSLSFIAIGHIKGFVQASNGNKPGTFYEFFVPVATSCHALATYSDEIQNDPEFDPSKKAAVVSTAELVSFPRAIFSSLVCFSLSILSNQLMTRVKDLMEAVKIAARLFPAEDSLATMRLKAFELVKTIKELVAAIKA